METIKQRQKCLVMALFFFLSLLNGGFCGDVGTVYSVPATPLRLIGLGNIYT